MKVVLVTGARGFIGRNLCVALRRNMAVDLREYDLGQTEDELGRVLGETDVIFHLAGVNRPEDPGEFETVNTGLTERVCSALQRLGRRPRVVLASSTQAALDNPYGRSKKAAEEAITRWASSSGGEAVAFRLSNVFGKWCRPNYNSVVATFCHNVARGIPLTLSDPGRELDLVYVDDVVQSFAAELELPGCPGGCVFREVPPIFRITLRDLAARIRSFRDTRETLELPECGDRFIRCLYATYLSYLDPGDTGYSLVRRSDSRGALAEVMKSGQLGQIFVSTTHPGIVRGNHYHDTKVEKFIVLSGEAEIRLRSILGSEVVTHRVSGEDLRVVDIPPGVGHCIENVGVTDLVVLFWASEKFDPAVPDAHPFEVSREKT